MIIKNEKGEYILFLPIEYEFPRALKEKERYNEYDPNWLKVLFRYLINGESQTEIKPCLLVQEMQNFIEKLKQEKNDEYIISLEPIEPDFDAFDLIY